MNEVRSITYLDECIIVIDNFLSPREHELIFNQCQLDIWEQTQPGNDKFWHFTDGPNYKNQKRWFENGPSNDSFDLWFKKLHTLLNENEDLRRRCGNVKSLSVRCHAYPVNSKNPWHTDLGYMTYSYYLHKKWQINWGAELLYFPPNPSLYQQTIEIKGENKHLDNYAQMKAPMELFDQADKQKNLMGLIGGRFLTALPNRIVFINKNVIHGVHRVDPDAGENQRLILTGLIGN